MANYAKAYGSLNPKTDAEWFTDDIGGEFLIAPMQNPSFMLALKKNTKQNSTEDPNETMYDAAAPSARLMAEFIVLDWNSVEYEDEKGETITEYSVDNALNLMLMYETTVLKWIINKSEELQEKMEKKVTKGKKK